MTDENQATDISRAAAVTGHRALFYGIDGDELKKTFETLIEGGIDTFYLGLATGFDTVCFKILYELKTTHCIRLVGCAPFRGQSEKWNKEDRDFYREMCFLLDELVVLSETYTPYCMHERNRYMVDRAGTLVAYLKRRFGGTYYTVRYAREKERKIVYV